MERKNEKEFYLFADNAYNEEKPKIYAETWVSGAMRVRAMNILVGLSSAAQTTMHVECLPTGRQAGIPLL